MGGLLCLGLNPVQNQLRVPDQWLDRKTLNVWLYFWKPASMSHSCGVCVVALEESLPVCCFTFRAEPSTCAEMSRSACTVVSIISMLRRVSVAMTRLTQLTMNVTNSVSPPDPVPCALIIPAKDWYCLCMSGCLFFLGRKLGDMRLENKNVTLRTMSVV